MIQYRIPTEYADAVREAGQSFWWGVVGEHQFTEDYYNGDPASIPADVQAMLNPCRWCEGKNPQCFYCRDGHPLVELVTDCPECGGSGTIQLDVNDDECEDIECDECDATGSVSLGVVTADEVLPIEPNHDGERTYDLIVTVGAWFRNAYLWRCGTENDRRGLADPIRLLARSDATHAVRFSGSESR